MSKNRQPRLNSQAQAAVERARQASEDIVNKLQSVNGQGGGDTRTPRDYKRLKNKITGIILRDMAARGDIDITAE